MASDYAGLGCKGRAATREDLLVPDQLLFEIEVEMPHEGKLGSEVTPGPSGLASGREARDGEQQLAIRHGSYPSVRVAG